MEQRQAADTAGDPYSVRAVSRVLDLLDALRHAQEPLSLLQLAGITRLPKSSTFRYLATLERRRYVTRDPDDGTYRLGSAFLPLHTEQAELLITRARPHMRELRDRLQETVNLAVFDGTRVAYLEILESPKAMRLATRLGDRDPLHSTALGKAVSAQMEDREVREVLASEGMPCLTRHTITDIDRYLEEVREVRRRGFAFDNCENEEGARCLAVPLAYGPRPAALSVSAPAVRFPVDTVEYVAAELNKVARLLTGNTDSRQEEST